MSVITFRALQLEDQSVFQKYLANHTFHTYEYSFLTLYLWKDYEQVEYGIMHDALIIKKREENKGAFFMQPLGYTEETLPEIIEALIRVKREDVSFKYLFREIEEPFMLQLQRLYGENVKGFEDKKYFDYIYSAQKLISLSGEKLGKRKNQVHQFVNAYDYRMKDIHEDGVKEDCYQFARTWLDQQKDQHRELIFELKGIGNVFAHLDRLPVMGMAVYIQGRIAGFTFGEKINRQMAIIHVEKGDTSYKGIYAFMNKTFAENYLSDVTWINREEDLGMARLKKAKEAYGPVRLEKKYKLNIF